MGTQAYLSKALPPDAFFTAIDAAGKMSERLRMIRKARGLKSGIPDWFIGWNKIVLWAEQKIKDGRLSDNQELRRDEILRAGFHWCEFRTLEELEYHLRRVGIPLRAVVMTPVERDAWLAAPRLKKASRARAPRPDAARLRKIAAVRSRVIF